MQHTFKGGSCRLRFKVEGWWKASTDSTDDSGDMKVLGLPDSPLPL